jgi:hypothetical protein
MVLSVNGSENARLRAAELILETTLPMPDEW